MYILLTNIEATNKINEASCLPLSASPIRG